MPKLSLLTITELAPDKVLNVIGTALRMWQSTGDGIGVPAAGVTDGSVAVSGEVMKKMMRLIV